MIALQSVAADQDPEATPATTVGVPVLVPDVDVRDTGTELTARCRHDGHPIELLHRSGVPTGRGSRVDPRRIPSMPRPGFLRGRHLTGLAVVVRTLERRRKLSPCLWTEPTIKVASERSQRSGPMSC